MSWTFSLWNKYGRKLIGIQLDRLIVYLEQQQYYSNVMEARSTGTSRVITLCLTGQFKKDTQTLHTTDMKMQRFAEGNTKKDPIKNEDIWMEQSTTFLRKRRLIWYGQVLRKERWMPTRR